MKNEYDDIINLPHHVSSAHKSMSLYDRAAQFAPFAALTGYGAAINETSRLTEDKIELSEDEQSAINDKLTAADGRRVSVMYFKPDTRKEGGSYVTLAGVIRKIDKYMNRIVMEDGNSIPLSDIIGVEVEDTRV